MVIHYQNKKKKKYLQILISKILMSFFDCRRCSVICILCLENILATSRWHNADMCCLYYAEC